MSSPAPIEPPDFRIPVVRHFIACERIDTSAGGNQYSLIDVIHALEPEPGVSYPRIQPVLGLFAQITDGRGAHSFQVHKVFADDESTHKSQAVILDLGNDPLVVRNFPFRLKNLLFERPGLYYFLLMCDGKEIAREPILLEANP